MDNSYVIAYTCYQYININNYCIKAYLNRQMLHNIIF